MWKRLANQYKEETFVKWKSDKEANKCITLVTNVWEIESIECFDSLIGTGIFVLIAKPGKTIS